MSIELCKYAGGKCDLCGDGVVCTRVPPVDMGVANRFIEDHRREFPFPTCDSFEDNWRKALGIVERLVSAEHNTWDGLSRSGSLVLKVQPRVTLDPSKWFSGGCMPVITTLIEKNPNDIHDLLTFGAQNGVALCYGIPFAVSTRRILRVMRPVVLTRRQELLNGLSEFETKFGPIYNPR